MDGIKQVMVQVEQVNYRFETDKRTAESQTQTIIQTTKQRVEREINEATASREQLEYQYSANERKYREDSKMLMTQRQIQGNIDTIHKVLRGEQQPDELPPNLLPMLKLLALITRENEAISLAQEKLHQTTEQETIKLSRKISELEETRNTALNQVRTRFISVIDRFRGELAQGIDCIKM